MNRIFISFVLVVLLLVAGEQTVFAQNVNTTEQLISVLRRNIQNQYKVLEKDVLIIWADDALEDKLSKVGSGYSAQINPMDVKRLIGKRFLLLNVLQNNVIRRKLNVKVTVDVWVHAFQTIRPIQRGEPFTRANVKKVRKRLSKLPKNFIRRADNIVSHVAYRNLTNQRVLTAAMVKALPIITKGDRIKIIVVNGNLQLSAQGTALQDASKNQMFRVKILNFGGKKTVYAQAISSGVARMVVK